MASLGRTSEGSAFSFALNQDKFKTGRLFLQEQFCNGNEIYLEVSDQFQYIYVFTIRQV